MSFLFKPSSGAGKYLFVGVEEPVTVTLLEDLGQIEAVGKGATDKDGNQRFWEAFRVRYAGQEKLLVGGWRLRAALKEGLKDAKEETPTCRISCQYETEKLKSGAIVAVKKFGVEPIADSDIAF